VEIGPLVSRQVLTVAPGDTIEQAAREIAARRVGSAIVPTEEGPGIITELDILRAVASGRDLKVATVEEYMTAGAITAFADWDLRQAAQRMVDGGVRHLIVLSQGGQLEGILSIRDLVKALLREAETALQ
jgi:CBS domain-containing protein